MNACVAGLLAHLVRARGLFGCVCVCVCVCVRVYVCVSARV